MKPTFKQLVNEAEEPGWPGVRVYKPTEDWAGLGYKHWMLSSTSPDGEMISGVGKTHEEALADYRHQTGTRWPKDSVGESPINENHSAADEAIANAILVSLLDTEVNVTGTLESAEGDPLAGTGATANGVEKVLRRMLADATRAAGPHAHMFT